MATKGAYLVSWSGGKDSALALMRALSLGLEAFGLLHFERDYGAHGVPAMHIKKQAESAGVEFVNRKVLTSDNYEELFVKTVKSVPGVQGIVFGDIYLREHRDWLERVCDTMDIEAVFPLWGEDTMELSREFLECGGRTTVVSAKKDLIESRWVGRIYDQEFVSYLVGKGLDPCGENGEFHTFVTRCPQFAHEVTLAGNGTYERDGHCYYDIKG
jgi:diphthine-ammonia ligase